MKNKILKILVVCMIIPCAVVMTACSFNIKDINWKFWEKEPSPVHEQEMPTEQDDQVPVEPEPTEPEPVSFAADSWETISEISASGNARDYYNIGDEKEVYFAGDAYTFQILGFNHDDLADGSGKAGITIGLKGLFSVTFSRYNVYQDFDGQANGSWIDSIYENTEAIPLMWKLLPEELKSVIKVVSKPSAYFTGEITYANSKDNLFLFSEQEIYGLVMEARASEGEQYEYWFNQNGNTLPENFPVEAFPNAIMYLKGTACDWLLRSKYSRPIVVGTTTGGVPTTTSTKPSNATYGVCFGFCV